MVHPSGRERGSAFGAAAHSELYLPWIWLLSAVECLECAVPRPMPSRTGHSGSLRPYSPSAVRGFCPDSPELPIAMANLIDPADVSRVVADVRAFGRHRRG